MLLILPKPNEYYLLEQLSKKEKKIEENFIVLTIFAQPAQAKSQRVQQTCCILFELIVINIWNIYLSQEKTCPVGCGSKIHWLLFCWGVRRPYECPGYDTKQSDGEVPVMLEVWGMWSTPSLPSLPGPLWPEVVAPEKGPIYRLDKIKPWFREFTVFCIQTTYLC